MLESVYDKIEETEEEVATTKNKNEVNWKEEKKISKNHTLIVGSHTLHVLRHIRVSNIKDTQKSGELQCKHRPAQ